METIAIVKPGDKATIYLNPYFLNFSREKPWDKDEGDFIWLPDNPGYQVSDGLPEGLRIRSQEEMTNIGSAAILEVQKGGYELDEVVCVPLTDPKFSELLERLDSGSSQMLVTYASMLPSQYVKDGIPTENFLERARKHNWRIALISLFADPYKSSLYWRSNYVHFGKGEEKEGVLLTFTDPSLDWLVNGEPEKPKRKGLFRR
jgi:hypothetical protein